MILRMFKIKIKNNIFNIKISIIKIKKLPRVEVLVIKGK